MSDEREAWVTVRVSPGSNRNAVMAAMFNAGVQGIEEVGDALVTHVSGQTSANDVLCAVMSASADARVETTPLPNVDWSERWKLGIHVQSLGALSVAPPWLSADLDPARTPASPRELPAQRALHPDDAVALERGLGDDLRDRLARDRDPAQP